VFIDIFEYIARVIARRETLGCCLMKSHVGENLAVRSASPKGSHVGRDPRLSITADEKKRGYSRRVSPYVKEE